MYTKILTTGNPFVCKTDKLKEAKDFLVGNGWFLIEGREQNDYVPSEKAKEFLDSRGARSGPVYNEILDSIKESDY